MRISDWSSDVCSSDLGAADRRSRGLREGKAVSPGQYLRYPTAEESSIVAAQSAAEGAIPRQEAAHMRFCLRPALIARSEEHTSELQSLMRISYAVFCLKKKKKYKNNK